MRLSEINAKVAGGAVKNVFVETLQPNYLGAVLITCVYQLKGVGVMTVVHKTRKSVLASGLGYGLGVGAILGAYFESIAIGIGFGIGAGAAAAYMYRGYVNRFTDA
jgi:hypothetical protein